MGDFECIIWKVQHGSAAFLRTPNDRTIMFDAGCSEDFSPAKHLAQNYGLDPQHNRLSKLIISHADRDHIQDLPNVRAFLNPRILSRNNSVPEAVVFPSGPGNLQEPLKSYKHMNDTYNSPLDEADKHIPISNWGNVLVQTFRCEPKHIPDCPKEGMKNNLSLVSYVRYLDTEIVFPGDLEPYGWHALLENTEIKQYVGVGKCRILVASHHGRESGIRYDFKGKKYVYDAFLKVMKPNLVIMSDKRGTETTDSDA